MAANDLRTEDVVTVAEFRSSLRKFLRRSELVADSCGLTPQRYLLLLAVKGAPDGSQTRTIGDVATDLQLAQSSATELVDRAEASGLVVRMASPHDGRVVRIRLSPTGEERLARAFAALSRDRLQLLEHLDHARTHLAADGHGAAGA